MTLIDPQDCILFLLSKAYQKAYAVSKIRLQPYALTPVQNVVIITLSEMEGASAGDLAKKLMLDNATLSGILDRLAESGWIAKNEAENDKRFLSLMLTSKAHEKVEKLKEEITQTNEELLKGFRVEERILLRRFLKDLQK
jgi:DNA-binding MarR family transcriptional regulator